MHKSISSAIALLAMAFSVNVFADAAKTLVVNEKIEVNAPADAVWAKVNNFGDLGAWHPAVTKTESPLAAIMKKAPCAF